MKAQIVRASGRVDWTCEHDHRTASGSLRCLTSHLKASGALPPKQRRQVENATYAAFAERAIKALVERASEDPEALRPLVGLSKTITEAVGRAIDRAVASEGYSYGEIAATLGVSRQAVRQRAMRQHAVVAD